MLSLKKPLPMWVSKKPQEAKYAEQVRETALPPETIAGLLDLCAREEQKQLKTNRISRGLGAIYLSAVIAVSLYAACTKNLQLFSCAMPFSLLTSPFTWISDLLNNKPLVRRKKAFLRLLNSDYPRVLVPLLNPTRIVDKEMTPIWLQAIARLLWNIAPGDILTFDVSRCDTIRRILTQLYPAKNGSSKREPIAGFSDEMADAVVSALRAVATLGDTKARKIVQQLANTEGNTNNERCVQEVAQECLVLLEAQVAARVDISKHLVEIVRRSKPGDDSPLKLRQFLETLAPEMAMIAISEYRRQKLQIRKRAVRYGLLLQITIWSLLFASLPKDTFSFTIFAIGVCFAFSPFLSPYRYPDFSAHAGIYLLGPLDDVRLVGLLLDEFADYQNQKVPYLETALERALLQLKPGDGYLISPFRRAHLRRIVHRRRTICSKGLPAKLVVVALNALAVIGDPSVIELAHMVLGDAKDIEVREAAERLIADYKTEQETKGARIGTMTP